MTSSPLVARIPQEYPLWIKGLVLFQNLHCVPVEPSMQLFRLCGPGKLSQIILVARRLAIVRVLIVEPAIAQRHISRFRMLRLSRYLGSEGIQHPTAADHIWIRMKAVNSV